MLPTVGTYELTAFASGYLPLARTVHVSAQGPVQLNFTLARAPQSHASGEPKEEGPAQQQAALDRLVSQLNLLADDARRAVVLATAADPEVDAFVHHDQNAMVILINSLKVCSPFFSWRISLKVIKL